MLVFTYPAETGLQPDEEQLRRGDEALSQWVAQQWDTPGWRWERLMAEDSQQDDPAALLARAADAEALLTQLQARQARDLAALRRLRLAEQEAAHGPHPPSSHVDPDGWVPSEVGFALGLSESQVRHRLAFADGLRRYRALARLVDDGGVVAWTAQKLVEHLDTLAVLVPDERLEAVEKAVVAWLAARPRSVGALNRRMRRLVLHARAAAGLLDDDAVAQAQANRRVHVRPTGDGCAELWALLPEPDALAVVAALDAAGPGSGGRVRDRRPDPRATPGRRPRRGGDGHSGRPRAGLRPGRDAGCSTRPHRARDQRPGPDAGRRSRSGGGPRVRPGGARDGPGPVAGRRAAGRGGYAHPPVVEALLHGRDRTCRAPGCQRAARWCDCDHVVPWPDGETSVANSCCLCRYHHRLTTHAPGWSLAGQGDGDLTWTTPTGARVVTEPYDYSGDAGPDDPPS